MFDFPMIYQNTSSTSLLCMLLHVSSAGVVPKSFSTSWAVQLKSKRRGVRKGRCEKVLWVSLSMHHSILTRLSNLGLFITGQLDSQRTVILIHARGTRCAGDLVRCQSLSQKRSDAPIRASKRGGLQS